MPMSIKERVKDFIPKELNDKIATENDAKTIDELKTFLKQHRHPIVEKWKEAPVEAVPEAVEEKEVPTAVPMAQFSTLPVTAGGFKIILKDAKIYAKKVIIKVEKKPEKAEKW
jgi:acetyl-CoA decarbonylase/synthase complex subunit beta